MIDSSPWIAALLLMPGVALLILSTAVRYNRLHDEAFRARRFCNALEVLEDHLNRDARGAGYG
jgi:hypothetical protein